MFRPLYVLNFAILTLAVIAGCGGVQPVPGGTHGVLRAGSETLSDMQVTIHRIEGHDYFPVGFAVTKSDGTFELVSNDAEGPLVLTEGAYCCTLESAGAPYQFPMQFSKASTTPLKVNWTGTDDKLDIQVPIPRMVK